jgi:hypothetical protein
MTDTFRALCEELLQPLSEYDDANPYHEHCSLITRARAALAQPEQVAPTDEEIGEWHDQCADLTRLGEVDHYWAFDLRSDEVAGVVRAALSRWGTPANQPVPVSERLPGPEDCDEEGRCWLWNSYENMWDLIDLEYRIQDEFPHSTHWLPHWALPVPTPANSTRGMKALIDAGE